MHIVSIVGARPQFVKAAMVSRALAEAGLEETLIHTGQHYDANMSDVFFEALGLNPPTLNLDVGSGTHAIQTGEMMIRLEAWLLAQDQRPDWLLVYGDTNSTLAGALVAAKLHIPLAHVEAGLRSFNRKMPEEINRVVTDQLSTLLFCPSAQSVHWLADEGITAGVHITGDVMRDATLHYAARARTEMALPDLLPFTQQPYLLATIHRAENTDDPTRLQAIFEGFGRMSRPVVLPLHPRTKSRIQDLQIAENVHLIDPVGYIEMLTLVQHADRVVTDSGGLQKEAFWLGVPCLTVRPETEWVETLENGWNRLVPADPQAMVDAVHAAPTGEPTAFGAAPDGGLASAVIARLLDT